MAIVVYHNTIYDIKKQHLMHNVQHYTMYSIHTFIGYLIERTPTTYPHYYSLNQLHQQMLSDKYDLKFRF